MRTLILIFIGLSLTGCSIHQMTEGRTKRNLDVADATVADILEMGVDNFLVDSLANKRIRRNLRKVHAEKAEIFRGKHHEFGVDSLIVLSRHNFMLTFGEIVIDFKQGKRDLTNNQGLKRVGNRVYFRKSTLAIS